VRFRPILERATIVVEGLTRPDSVVNRIVVLKDPKPNSWGCSPAPRSTWSFRPQRPSFVAVPLLTSVRPSNRGLEPDAGS